MRLTAQIGWALGTVNCFASALLASQEEFLKALGGSPSAGGGATPVAGGGGDPTKLLAFLAVLVAAVILIAWIAQARKSAAARSIHHPGKLVKEVTKKVGLKPGQLKKLKSMADEADVSNPLVLLLCPSLMAETVKKGKK